MQEDLLDKTTLLGMTRYQKALLQAVLRNSRDVTAPSLSDVTSEAICRVTASLTLGINEVVRNAFFLMNDSMHCDLLDPTNMSQNRDIPITKLADFCLIKDLEFINGKWIFTSGKFEGTLVDLSYPGPGRRNIGFSDTLSYILKTRYKSITGDASLDVRRRGQLLKTGDMLHLALAEMHIQSPDYRHGYAYISDLIINIIDGTYFKSEGTEVSISEEKSIDKDIKEVSAPSRDDDFER